MDTKIQYSLPVDSHVILTIYNLYGQEIKRLVDDFQNAGRHTTTWDGKDRRGNEVGSGVYFYAMEYGKERLIRKLTVLP
jgi:flagellar hook assembly protein FlgD